MNIKSEEMTNFTIKIDKKTREDYSELCKEIGLSMSAATLALIRQAVRSQSMSAATLALIRQAVRSQSMFFSLRDENGFTPSEAAELRRRMEDVKKGIVEMHPLVGEDE